MKHWCYTLNNYTDEDPTPSPDLWSYHVIGKKVGEGGTPHLQGYIEFKTQKRITAVRKLIPRAHWEKPQGSQEQASVYCKKDGDFTEHGAISLPKNTTLKRNYAEAIAAAKEGRFDDIPSDMYRRHYTMKRIRQDYMTSPPDLEDVCGHWYVGPTGTGKSHTARERYPVFYDKLCNKWWDGYQGQKTVIIDNFDTNHVCLAHHLKRWADRYSFPAEHRGTTVQIRPVRIVVTSNDSIESLFSDDPVLCVSLLSRFTVEHFDTVFPDKN